jgi:hypothetical protein
MNTTTLRDTLANYFKERPNVWLDGIALEAIAGRYAWRSRVSDCRRELGMDIKNRMRRQTDATGKRWTTSEYQYIPAIQSEPDDTGVLVLRGHDTGYQQ